MTAEERRICVFEKIPVRRAVWTQVMPAIASQMIVLVYNLADTYFVGLLNDPIQTAAVTIALPPFFMLTAMSNLFGVGGASLIAQSLGKKENGAAKQIAGISFCGGFFCAMAYAVIFSIFASPILRLCGATDNIYEATLGYARWVIIFGGPGAVLNTLLASLVRAEGAASNASVGVSIGGVINIILDPFFVLPQYLGYGAVGAGLATAISNLIAALYFIIYVAVRKGTTIIRFAPSNLKAFHCYLRPILSIGIPSAVQNVLTVVSIAALSKFVSGYGEEAVAGLGIVKKLDQVPLYVSIGVSNGLLPLLAYNHAAGNHERRKQIFQFGCVISCGFSILCLFIYEGFAAFLTGLFIDDPLTKEYGATFLRIMVTAMPLMAVCYPMIIQFQAIGKVRESLSCSILRKGVLDIPLLFIMNRLIPLYGCMMVQPIVDLVSLVVAAALYQRVNRTLARDQKM